MLRHRQVAVVEVLLNRLGCLKLLLLFLQLNLIAVDFFLYLVHLLLLLIDFFFQLGDVLLHVADLLFLGQSLLLQPLILDSQLRDLPLHLVLFVLIRLLPLLDVGGEALLLVAQLAIIVLLLFCGILVLKSC